MLKRLLQIILAAAGLLAVPIMAALCWLWLRAKRQWLTTGGVTVIYSQVPWDEVWQRPQQFAWLQSATRPVLYCGPVQPHNLANLGVRWRYRRCFNRPQPLLVLSPLVFSGMFKSATIYRINSWLMAHLLRAALGSATVHCLVNSPFALHTIRGAFYSSGARQPRLRRLLFDVIDDFTVFEWSPPFAAQLDDELSRLADAVIAGTIQIAHERNVPYIGCGVDYDLFSAPGLPAPAIARFPRPVLGYFGTISERIDLDLIAALAREFPAASVVLVGPVHLPHAVLPQAPNIHYLGLRPHGDLPAFARGFTVGLIPFRLTTATLKLNPVKTLEYLSAGLPVVATALPDLKALYPDVIAIADTPQQFISHVRHGLTAPNAESITRGKAIAQQASWQVMTKEFDDLLYRNPISEPAGA